VDFEFAPVAGTRIDLPDREAVSQPTLRRFVQAGGERGEFRIDRRTWTGQWSPETFEEEF
jgi:hypothetical protein